MDEQTYKRAALDVRDSVSEMAGQAKQQAASALDTAQHAAMDTVGDLEAQIKKNPTQSALIAAGIGLVLGMLLSR